MVNLLGLALRRDPTRAGTIAAGGTTVSDYAALLAQAQSYGNMAVMGSEIHQTHAGLTVDPIASHFVGLANAHNLNPVVFACMAVRSLVFSAVRFRWQRLLNGKPSDTFGTGDLALLETPWVGGTTQDLLSRTIQDADLAGNAYWTVVREGRALALVRLRPDWVEIAVEKRWVRAANSAGGRSGTSTRRAVRSQGRTPSSSSLTRSPTSPRSPTPWRSTGGCPG